MGIGEKKEVGVTPFHDNKLGLEKKGKGRTQKRGPTQKVKEKLKKNLRRQRG